MKITRHSHDQTHPWRVYIGHYGSAGEPIHIGSFPTRALALKRSRQNCNACHRGHVSGKRMSIIVRVI
jgi:hypothetical protein